MVKAQHRHSSHWRLSRGGWIWDYVSLFPSTRTPPPGGDASFKRISATRYVIDGPTYPLRGGPLVTEHHVCTKR